MTCRIPGCDGSSPSHIRNQRGACATFILGDYHGREGTCQICGWAEMAHHEVLPATSSCTSVITLTYNRPSYLAQAIASIEQQTDQNYEHIVLDNGSTDPRVTEVLLSAKSRRPERFRIYGRIPTLDIVGRHWNSMLGASQGKYITILDDDNRKLQTFIERTIAPMEADESIDAVTCGWLPVDENGTMSAAAVHINLKTSLAQLYKDNTIDSNAVTFRRSVLDKIGMFDPDLTTNEDWHFMIRLVRHCKVVHLPDVLLEYRVHEGARSRRALALGAHENWERIRTALFSPDEILSYKWRR